MADECVTFMHVRRARGICLVRKIKLRNGVFHVIFHSVACRAIIAYAYNGHGRYYRRLAGIWEMIMLLAFA
jgi:hypothetical protein